MFKSRSRSHRTKINFLFLIKFFWVFSHYSNNTVLDFGDVYPEIQSHDGSAHLHEMDSSDSHLPTYSLTGSRNGGTQVCGGKMNRGNGGSRIFQGEGANSKVEGT